MVLDIGEWFIIQRKQVVDMMIGVLGAKPCTIWEKLRKLNMPLGFYEDASCPSKQPWRCMEHFQCTGNHNWNGKILWEFNLDFFVLLWWSREQGLACQVQNFRDWDSLSPWKIRGRFGREFWSWESTVHINKLCEIVFFIHNILRGSCEIDSCEMNLLSLYIYLFSDQFKPMCLFIRFN